MLVRMDLILKVIIPILTVPQQLLHRLKITFCIAAMCLGDRYWPPVFLWIGTEGRGNKRILINTNKKEHKVKEEVDLNKLSP